MGNVILKIPLWDGNNTTEIVGQRIYNSVSGELTLKTYAPVVLSDNFDNSSLDTNNFGTHIAADGSVTETSSLSIRSLNSVDDAALVYYKTTLHPRVTTGYQLKLKMKCQNMNTNAVLPFVLCQDSSTPTCGSAATIGGKVLGLIRQRSDGLIYFMYYNTSGTAYYWTGTAWSTSISSAYSGSVGIVYVYIIENDGLNLIFKLLDSTESTLLASATILWSGVRAESGSTYIVWGENCTDYHYGEMVVSNFTHSRYYSLSSPETVGAWVALPAGSVLDMSTFFNPELMNSGDAGSVKYKYAVNGGALSAAKTQAEMQAESDVTITDASQSVKIIAQLISDSVQKSTCSSNAWMTIALPTGSGGGKLIDGGLM